MSIALEDSISVLLPVYNDGVSAVTAIESALAQSKVPSRVIVVNDGSSDDTGNILEANYGSNSRVTILHLPNNSGLVGALRSGLKEIETKWVARLDSDDTWLPNHLETIISMIEEYPDLVLCGCRSTACTETSDLPKPAIKHALLKDNPFIHSSVAFRKDVCEKVGSYQFEKFEDYGLWIRMIKEGDAYISSSVTVSHNKRVGSLSDLGKYKSRSYRLSYQLLAMEEIALYNKLLMLFQMIIRFLLVFKVR